MTLLPLSMDVAAVIRRMQRLAFEVPEIVAVGLVGSWARTEARADSDVDLIVLTTAPSALLNAEGWHSRVHPDATLIRSNDFGAIHERRLLLPNGLEVEVGIGTPSWADTRPVDAGTRVVVVDGMRPVYDPVGLLDALLGAVK